MSLTAPRASLLLALFLCGAAGCQFFAHPGPSDVAQGRYFSSGNPDYDTFFVELYHLQVELKDAPEQVAEPRQELAKSLDVGLDADVIKEALGKRAAELGGKQVKLTVARGTDSDKPVSLKVTGSPAGDDAEFVKTLEQALAKIGELESTIGGWQKSLDALPKQETELTDGFGAAFASAPPGKRADVKKNLTDAQKIIELLVARAKDAEHANAELLGAVVAALGETAAPSNEKASEAAPEKASNEKNEKGDRSEKKGRKGTPPAAKAARAPKPPPPAPKPAPKPPAPKPPAPKPEPKSAAEKPAPQPAPAPKTGAEHGEVPPAPKPTQGTAKPDFEP
jgi:hypothetical protein